MLENLRKVDSEVFAWVKKEEARQHDKVELIASENFVSSAVREAAGSILTNKYAEGYPGKRYYGGCEFVDEIERIAIERAKKLFDAEHANLQPHSGSQANQGVYFAMVPIGGTILGMDLSHGGHLTHGSPVNQSGTYYNFVHYGVTKDMEMIDYEQVRALALKHKPRLIVAGASAYPRIIDFQKFRQIADEIKAYFLVDMAHIAGLVAAGLHPNPVEYADFVTTTTHKTLRGIRGGLILCREQFAKAIDKAIFPGLQGGPLMHIIAAKAVSLQEALAEDFLVYQKQVLKNATALADALTAQGFRLVSGGTDNHLILVDLTNMNVTGKEAEKILDEVGITVNKNTIPFETRSPFVTSGIRLGTPAITTRGFQEPEMQEIAQIMFQVITNQQNESKLALLKEQITALCDRF